MTCKGSRKRTPSARLLFAIAQHVHARTLTFSRCELDDEMQLARRFQVELRKVKNTDNASWARRKCSTKKKRRNDERMNKVLCHFVVTHASSSIASFCTSLKKKRKTSSWKTDVGKQEEKFSFQLALVERATTEASVHVEVVLSSGSFKFYLDLLLLATHPKIVRSSVGQLVDAHFDVGDELVRRHGRFVEDSELDLLRVLHERRHVLAP